MARRKNKEPKYDPNLPEPRLEWRDGKPFVTDGYIMGSKMIVREQPSIETIKYVNNMFAEQAIKLEKEAKECGKTIEEYINMKKECSY